MSREKIFADGFAFKRKENAPDFVVGSMSVKVDEAILFLKDKAKKGWVNIDIKQAKSGKHYCELDTWEPKPQDNSNTKATAPVVEQSTVEEPDLPF